MLNNILNFLFPKFNLDRRRQLLTLLLALFLGQSQTEKATAQIVPDTTLPNNSIVNNVDNLIEITGGTTAGNNLFHSFTTFSVPTNFQAYFLNNPDLRNIITRVTGNSLSEIDGLIQANGSTNLILINPNGIIFGSSASLNLGGSFLGSTANSIKFSDGSEFSSINPEATPILSINVPLGLQFGGDNGEIAVRGNGNNLIYNSDNFVVIKDFRNLGLQVNNGETLALIGGNISLTGGNLTAPDGSIELGAIGSGFVGITPLINGWSFNYEGAIDLQDIQLIEAASLDTSGNSGGNIEIQGRNLLVADASAIFADTLGGGTGGSIRLNTTESIEAVGFSLNEEIPFLTYISADVAPNATGNGGTIDIATNNLFVGFGAQISTNTFGSGNGGTININVPEIILTSGSPIAGPSGLFAAVAFDTIGNGGKININSQNLEISDGAQIGLTSFSFGDGGNIEIEAQNILISGTSPSGFPSGIFASAFGETGKSGQITIAGDRLNIIDDGSIQSTAFSSGGSGNISLRLKQLTMTEGATIFNATDGSGNAGNIEIEAQIIELTGANGVVFQTSISSTSLDNASGDGGDIIINTDRLLLQDGAQIAVATVSSGNGGTLTIDASESIILSGISDMGRSGLFASAVINVGNGGDILVDADKLTVTDGAIISTSNFLTFDSSKPLGQGAAGNVRLNAKVLQLDNGGIITSEAAFGDRGNIFIDSDRLLLAGESRITTSALETATGGNIEIFAETIVAFENSDITANAVENFAGKVTINAKSIFGTEFANFLTPESDITASSDLGVAFNGVVTIETPDIDPARGLVELSSAVVDPSKIIVDACSSEAGNISIVRGKGGLPVSPLTQQIDTTIWQDLRDLDINISNSISNNSRAILPDRKQPIVEARELLKKEDGTIELIANVDFNNSIFSRLTC
jgi:filamentous hemagglutinin family protein